MSAATRATPPYPTADRRGPPRPAAADPGRLTLLEAAPGPARRAAVADWLDAARRTGATPWQLPGDYRRGGDHGRRQGPAGGRRAGSGRPRP